MKHEAVWFPIQEYMEQTRLYDWMTRLGFTDYDSFYEKSIDDIAWFWHEAEKELGISWSTPYTNALDLSKGVKYPHWFVDGKMNIFDSAVSKWAALPGTKHKTAVIWEGDDGEMAAYTFDELNQAVTKTAAGLNELGVKRGDIVSIYMPMIPETIISMLAIAKIGAIFSPAFSGYGAEAVAARINAAGAKWLITADGYYRRGKVVSMKAEADRAVLLSETIEKVIVVKRTKKSTSWNEAVDVDWSTIANNENDFKTVDTGANEPLMLLYTSGTTGKPKGVVHTHGGFPIKAAFDAGICMDLKQDDTLFWYTDMGWMMGPFLLFGGLLNGSAILVYEGTPDYPQPSRLWSLVERHFVTHLGISPTLIRGAMNHGEAWLEKNNLSSLKVIGSTGEPWNQEAWLWLFEKVGKSQVPIFNYSGGTEISGGILGNTLLKPITPTSFNSPILGMDAHVYDEDGSPIIQAVGELVIVKPWVGMTSGFWKEHQRYEETYWNRWPDTWVHGDWVVKDADGYFMITGRSDDILNVAGKRLGPAELESSLTVHDEVLEAAAIGVPDPVKGEAAVCFIVLKQKVHPKKDIILEELFSLVISHLGKALKPKEIYFVDELPKTKNGKVMRRVIKAAYLKQSTGDLSSLDNQGALTAITNLKKPSQP